MINCDGNNIIIVFIWLFCLFVVSRNTFFVRLKLLPQTARIGAGVVNGTDLKSVGASLTGSNPVRSVALLCLVTCVRTWVLTYGMDTSS